MLGDPVRALSKYSKKVPFHGTGTVSGIGATSGYGYLEMEGGQVIVYLTQEIGRLVRLGQRAQIIGRIRGWSPLLEAVVIDGYVRE